MSAYVSLSQNGELNLAPGVANPSPRQTDDLRLDYSSPAHSKTTAAAEDHSNLDKSLDNVRMSLLLIFGNHVGRGVALVWSTCSLRCCMLGCCARLLAFRMASQMPATFKPVLVKADDSDSMAAAMNEMQTAMRRMMQIQARCGPSLATLLNGVSNWCRHKSSCGTVLLTGNKAIILPNVLRIAASHVSLCGCVLSGRSRAEARASH